MIKGVKMNKNEFISQVNNKIGLTKKDCKLCLETIITVIKDALKHGESVTLSNFGKFKVNQIKSKPMYSFKTGQTYVAEPRRAPVFKASDNLKRSVK